MADDVAFPLLVPLLMGVLLLQVVKVSDVLFLFGGLAEVRDTIKSIKDELKDHQIIVPVTKEGNLDVFQVLNAAMASQHLLQSRTPAFATVAAMTNSCCMCGIQHIYIMCICCSL